MNFTLVKINDVTTSNNVMNIFKTKANFKHIPYIYFSNASTKSIIAKFFMDLPL